MHTAVHLCIFWQADREETGNLRNQIREEIHKNEVLTCQLILYRNGFISMHPFLCLKSNAEKSTVWATNHHTISALVSFIGRCCQWTKMRHSLFTGLQPSFDRSMLLWTRCGVRRSGPWVSHLCPCQLLGKGETVLLGRSPATWCGGGVALQLTIHIRFISQEHAVIKAVSNLIKIAWPRS